MVPRKLNVRVAGPALAIALLFVAISGDRPDAAVSGDFIVDIVIANFSSRPADADRCPPGYQTDGTDANKGARGKYIYLCAKKGRTAPIRSLSMVHGGDFGTSCPAGFFTHRYARWGHNRNLGSGDLNDGAGGKYIWLCTQSDGLGAPVKEIDVVPQNGADFLCETMKGSDWLPAGRTGTFGFPTDMNAGSTPTGELHDYIHLCFRDLSEDYDDEEVGFCGGEGELPCWPFHDLRLLNGNTVDPKCDRGLKTKDNVCQSDTRHQNPAWNFRYNWTYWALRNQRRDLAADVPISRVMFLGAHNAFNNSADRYHIAPNQRYSISDMLLAGIRVIDLDVHEPGIIPRRVVFAHGVPSATERFYYNGIKEIANFMRKRENHAEVVLLVLEDYLGESDADRVNDPIEVFLDRPDIGVFTPADFRRFGRFPTQREMRLMGKRVLVMAQDSTYGGKYVFRKGEAGDPRITYWSSGYNDWKADSGLCQVHGANFHPEEDTFKEVFESRIIEEGKAKITPYQLSRLALCNINIINLDQVLNPAGATLSNHQVARGEEIGRLDGAVWSWRQNDFGGHGRTVAMLWLPANQNERPYWASTTPSQVTPYACRLGDDFGADGDARWRITSERGVWANGFAACAREFPGSRFHVPTNAYQNDLLADVMRHPRIDAVWLNYSDASTDTQGEESTWYIGGEADRTPPVVEPIITGERGGGDWYTTDINYEWKVADPESDHLTDAGCDPGTVTWDTHSVLLRCSASSAGGRIERSVFIKRDTLPPTVAITRLMPPGPGQWNKGPVRFDFSCTDEFSGVYTCPPPYTFAAEGAGQTAALKTVDIAGNSGVITVNGVNIDRTRPATTAAATDGIGQPYQFGGIAVGPVHVVLDASDALSGVATVGYTIRGAQSGAARVAGYQLVLEITEVGETFVDFNAIDVAGNIEITKTVVVRVAGTSGWLPGTTPCGATLNDISPRLGGYRLDRGSGFFTQQVIVTNTTGQVHASAWLAVEGLTGQLALLDAAGATACGSHVGSPYVALPLGADNQWSPGESISVVLQFDNPTRAGITYSPRLVVGARP